MGVGGADTEPAGSTLWVSIYWQVSHPFDTGCLPLSYSGNPGVNGVSHRGANFGFYLPAGCFGVMAVSAQCTASQQPAAHPHVLGPVGLSVFAIASL